LVHNSTNYWIAISVWAFIVGGSPTYCRQILANGNFLFYTGLRARQEALYYRQYWSAFSVNNTASVGEARIHFITLFALRMWRNPMVHAQRSSSIL